MKKTICILHILVFHFVTLLCQNHSPQQIPSVYSNIIPNIEGKLTFDGFPEKEYYPKYTLSNLAVGPSGTEDGIEFNFDNVDFRGEIFYGLFDKDLPKYEQVVFYKKSAKIVDGKAKINIKEFKGKYDIAGLETNGRAKLGYRITNYYGDILYDGKINIEGRGPFQVGLSVIEGPFVSNVTDSGAIISFTTNRPCSPFVKIEDNEFRSAQIMANMMGDVKHEIKVHHLSPGIIYHYSVNYGDYSETYFFQSAPKPGTRKKFTFAFSSDSRSGNGGGERDLFGSNAYIMKKMAALAAYENVAFFQFTGDMINGYSPNNDEILLQYANWKRTIEPFWHYFPFYTGMGNHEAIVTAFDDGSFDGIRVDKFPFHTFSAEKTFSDVFVNPANGPEREDGAYYDPTIEPDFPSYNENVYYYTYDNIAVVVLNSNYWYTPTTKKIPEIGGNPKGYIMDQQLNWFKNTIKELNSNEEIDHIFVTIHTPALPNGGHVGDDMWHFGNNKVRPVVAGNPVEKGIIERRDEFLDIMINQSKKVVALLCGDEHNYSRMKITNQTNIYPEYYSEKKLKISRPIWQITNGTAGAPYYGQEILPWSNFVEFFTTQYALNLISVDGDKITMKVINPDTLEIIEEVVLKE